MEYSQARCILQLFDYVSASKYDMRVCENATQAFDECMAINDTMVLSGTLSSPQESGTTESIIVDLSYLDEPENDTSFYTMIKAVDAYSNAGPDSNLAQIPGPTTSQPQPPETPPPQPTATPTPQPSIPAQPPEGNNMVAIVAGTLACLALISTVLAGAVIRNMKHNKVDAENNEMNVENSNMPAASDVGPSENENGSAHSLHYV